MGAGHAQSPRGGSQLHIAAAADLEPVLPALASQYEAKTGVHIVPSFGSSATLTEQLQNGAPEDLFLSADCAHPQQLVDAKLTLDPQPALYARGVLVLWARRDSPAQPLSLGSLASPRVTRVAVANDRHAPYGMAATAAINGLNMQQGLAGKLVVGENIAQTAEFALTGNAQAAFISLTLASSPKYREAGSFIRIPAVYPRIQQCGVALSRSTNPQSAEAFLRWLTSDGTQNELSQFGLDPAR